jgi:hypothetical protein
MTQHVPAVSLFTHVFADLEGYIAVFTGQQARLTNSSAPENKLVGIRHKWFRYPESVEAAWLYSKREAELKRDCYFGAHLYQNPGPRQAQNAIPAVRCLWCDEDEGRFPMEGPEPTAVVSTSSNRRHLWWALTEPISVEVAVDLNRRIAHWAGADSGKAGLASVLRVPGTRNFKRLPTIDDVDISFESDVPWSPEILEQAIPPLPERSAPVQERGEYDGPKETLDDFLRSDRLKVIGPAPDNQARKYAVVCPWVEVHSGGDDSGSYVGEYPDGAKFFVCHHEHCQGRKWGDFRRYVRPVKIVKLRPRKSKKHKIRKAVIARD